jgi:hypothetical protein
VAVGAGEERKPVLAGAGHGSSNEKPAATTAMMDTSTVRDKRHGNDR